MITIFLKTSQASKLNHALKNFAWASKCVTVAAGSRLITGTVSAVVFIKSRLFIVVKSKLHINHIQEIHHKQTKFKKIRYVKCGVNR